LAVVDGSFCLLFLKKIINKRWEERKEKGREKTQSNEGMTKKRERCVFLSFIF